MKTEAFLASAALWVVACSGNSDLRGHWTASPDGKTYLVVSDDNGGGCGPMYVDGRKWGRPIGEAGEISPGSHTLHCGAPPQDPAYSQGIEFTIPGGVIYHFDYWGP